MLSFSTDFPIKACTPDAFATCVGEWVSKMPLGALDDVNVQGIVDGKIENVVSGSHTLERIAVNDAKNERLGFRHSVRDGAVTYSTEIVFANEGGDCWVGIRNDRVSEDLNFHLRESKKPQVIKALLQKIGGGLDGELYVKDSPHHLRDCDVGMAERLINGDSDGQLPIIYVSRDRYDVIDTDVGALARMAGGLAHVVVEPSRKFSRQIQPGTGGRNAYGGVLGVYMPNGERWLVFPEGRADHDVRREAVDRVRKALLHRKPRISVDWQNLRSLVSRKNIESLKESGSTDLEAFIREFDAENKTLSSQLAAANAELTDLRAQMRLRRNDISQQSLSLLKSQDYFPEEGHEFLREALEGTLGNLIGSSRRHEKISEAIANLGSTHEGRDRKSRLKDALNRASNLDDAMPTLKELGFSIKSEKNHYKLLYNADERFTFTCPKTASDHRSFKNLASDIARTIY